MSQPTSEGALAPIPRAADCESVDESDQPYPWEALDVAYDRYLEEQTIEHTNRMLHMGCASGCDEYFLPDNVEDLYSENVYAMSWFYHGCYDFDAWEVGFDDWLCGEAFRDRATDEGAPAGASPNR